MSDNQIYLIKIVLFLFTDQKVTQHIRKTSLSLNAPKFCRLPVIYSLKCIFAFSFQYQSDAQLLIFLFFPALILLTLTLFVFLFHFSSHSSSLLY